MDAPGRNAAILGVILAVAAAKASWEVVVRHLPGALATAGTHSTPRLVRSTELGVELGATAVAHPARGEILATSRLRSNASDENSWTHRFLHNAADDTAQEAAKGGFKSGEDDQKEKKHLNQKTDDWAEMQFNEAPRR